MYGLSSDYISAIIVLKSYVIYTRRFRFLSGLPALYVPFYVTVIEKFYYIPFTFKSHYVVNLQLCIVGLHRFMER